VSLPRGKNQFLFKFFPQLLFITNLATLPFQKVCGNHHVTLNVIIAQHVMFIVMLVIQNQRFINQGSFGVPLQPMMAIYY